MSKSQYLAIPKVSALIRKAPKTVRNLIARRVFRYGVHYFRPRGSTPLFKRHAVVQWIEQSDDSVVTHAMAVREAIRCSWGLDAPGSTTRRPHGTDSKD